jgi:hypothetical protein
MSSARFVSPEVADIVAKSFFAAAMNIDPRSSANAQR